MATEALKTMKEQLMGCVQGQLGNLQSVDTKQLGQAIDMIKDLSEAIYYCTITDAMEKTDKEEKQVNNINYYTTNPVNKMYPDYYRDLEKNNGYMYYPYMYYPSADGSSNGMRQGTSTSSNGNMNNSGSTSYYTQMPMNGMRDPRQGRAALRRKMYMEGKEKHKDTNSQLRELEAYLQELSTDITEMIKDASPEERATLHQKMTTLASKIG